MNSYIVEAAIILLSAKVKKDDNVIKHFQYACTGALKRYRTLQAAMIEDCGDIEELKRKSEALAFGQRCARYMTIIGVPTDMMAQAAVIKGLMFEKSACISKETVVTVLRSLLLRAQLRMHTNKPGFENIIGWLSDFYKLAKEYSAFIDSLAQMVCDPALDAALTDILDPTDPIIAMALNEKGEITEDGKNHSLIGKCVAMICRHIDFSRPLRIKEYIPSGDFGMPQEVDPSELEAICRQKVLGHVECGFPLIIENIEMKQCEDECVLIVDTKTGLRGISIVGGNWKYFYPILQKKLCPYFIGKDARDMEQLFEEIYVMDLNYKIQGLAYWCCVSWLEAALLDILGKATGKYIGELFGKRINESVSYYCASGNRATTPLEELEVLHERIAEVGAKAVKFKIGGRMSWDRDSIDGRSEELIVLARKYFGDEMVIHADSNGSFYPAKAIEYGHMLEDINAYFYEEPCRFDYLWENEQVAKSLKIPIAFGEQETSLRRFRYLIENHAVGVVQPDIQYFGGFIRTVKVARMAEKAGITITPHVSTGIQYANVLHLASFTPNIGKYQELKDGYNETKHYFTDKLILKNGSINIPHGVGLGMRFDSSFIDKGKTIFAVGKNQLH